MTADDVVVRKTMYDILLWRFGLDDIRNGSVPEAYEIADEILAALKQKDFVVVNQNVAYDDDEDAALWRDCVVGMAEQFGCRIVRKNQRYLTTCGLSNLEYAFELLGWDDPHIVGWGGCEYYGCNEWATCGAPTSIGYRRLCGEHFEALWGE